MVPDTVKDDIQAIRDALTGGTLDVNIASGGAGDGAILDGASSSIKATVKDLTNANPLTVAIVDTSGDQIASFGGGTQYTEGDTDATIVGTAIMWEDAANALTPVSSTKPLPVSASIDTTGLALETKQDTIIGHVDGIETLLGTIDADTSNISTKIDTIVGHVDGLETLIGTTNTTLTTIDGRVDGIEALLGTIDADTSNLSTKIDTIAGDTTSIQTAVELIDDTVATLGTTTYSEATTKGLIMGAVRRDADTTLVDTTNEVTPLQVDAAGRLKVEAFSGETLPVSLTSTTVTGTVAVTQSGTWDEVGINDSGNSITVDNGGTFVVQENGAALTALQLIDNSIYVDDADWTADTSSHTLVGAVTQVATTANTDGDTTPLTTNAFRELRTAIPESDLATAGTSHVKKYYTNAGAVTDGIVWSPAAGKRWYVTDLIINISAAATVTFEDDKAGGDEAVMKFELAANSGVSHTFNTPWYSGEDAADLIVTTTAGNVYITITGYEL